MLPRYADCSENGSDDDIVFMEDPFRENENEQESRYYDSAHVATSHWNAVRHSHEQEFYRGMSRQDKQKEHENELFEVNSWQRKSFPLYETAAKGEIQHLLDDLPSPDEMDASYFSTHNSEEPNHAEGRDLQHASPCLQAHGSGLATSALQLVPRDDWTRSYGEERRGEPLMVVEPTVEEQLETARTLLRAKDRELKQQSELIRSLQGDLAASREATSEREQQLQELRFSYNDQMEEKRRLEERLDHTSMTVERLREQCGSLQSELNKSDKMIDELQARIRSLLSGEAVMSGEMYEHHLSAYKEEMEQNRLQMEEWKKQARELRSLIDEQTVQGMQELSLTAMTDVACQVDRDAVMSKSSEDFTPQNVPEEDEDEDVCVKTSLAAQVHALECEIRELSLRNDSKMRRGEGEGEGGQRREYKEEGRGGNDGKSWMREVREELKKLEKLNVDLVAANKELIIANKKLVEQSKNEKERNKIQAYMVVEEEVEQARRKEREKEEEKEVRRKLAVALKEQEMRLQTDKEEEIRRLRTAWNKHTQGSVRAVEERCTREHEEEMRRMRAELVAKSRGKEQAQTTQTYHEVVHKSCQTCMEISVAAPGSCVVEEEEGKEGRRARDKGTEGRLLSKEEEEREELAERVKLILDMEWKSIGDLSLFSRELQKDVAWAVGIRETRVKVEEVREGSVVVILSVLPAESEEEKEVEEAVRALEEQVAADISSLKIGIRTRHVKSMERLQTSLPSSPLSLPREEGRKGVEQEAHKSRDVACQKEEIEEEEEEKKKEKKEAEEEARTEKREAERRELESDKEALRRMEMIRRMEEMERVREEMEGETQRAIEELRRSMSMEMQARLEELRRREEGEQEERRKEEEKAFAEVQQMDHCSQTEQEEEVSCSHAACQTEEEDEKKIVGCSISCQTEEKDEGEMKDAELQCSIEVDLFVSNNRDEYLERLRVRRRRWIAVEDDLTVWQESLERDLEEETESLRRAMEQKMLYEKRRQEMMMKHAMEDEEEKMIELLAREKRRMEEKVEGEREEKEKSLRAQEEEKLRRIREKLVEERRRASKQVIQEAVEASRKIREQTVRILEEEFDKEIKSARILHACQRRKVLAEMEEEHAAEMEEEEEETRREHERLRKDKRRLMVHAHEAEVKRMEKELEEILQRRIDELKLTSERRQEEERRTVEQRARELRDRLRKQAEEEEEELQRRFEEERERARRRHHVDVEETIRELEERKFELIKTLRRRVKESCVLEGVELQKECSMLVRQRLQEWKEETRRRMAEEVDGVFRKKTEEEEEAMAAVRRELAQENERILNDLLESLCRWEEEETVRLAHQLAEERRKAMEHEERTHEERKSRAIVDVRKEMDEAQERRRRDLVREEEQRTAEKLRQMRERNEEELRELLEGMKTEFERHMQETLVTTMRELRGVHEERMAQTRRRLEEERARKMAEEEEASTKMANERTEQLMSELKQETERRKKATQQECDDEYDKKIWELELQAETKLEESVREHRKEEEAKMQAELRALEEELMKERERELGSMRRRAEQRLVRLKQEVEEEYAAERREARRKINKEVEEEKNSLLSRRMQEIEEGTQELLQELQAKKEEELRTTLQELEAKLREELEESTRRKHEELRQQAHSAIARMQKELLERRESVLQEVERECEEELKRESGRMHDAFLSSKRERIDALVEEHRIEEERQQQEQVLRGELELSREVNALKEECKADVERMKLLMRERFSDELRRICTKAKIRNFAKSFEVQGGRSNALEQKGESMANRLRQEWKEELRRLMEGWEEEEDMLASILGQLRLVEETLDRTKLTCARSSRQPAESACCCLWTGLMKEIKAVLSPPAASSSASSSFLSTEDRIRAVEGGMLELLALFLPVAPTSDADLSMTSTLPASTPSKWTPTKEGRAHISPAPSTATASSLAHSMTPVWSPASWAGSVSPPERVLLDVSMATGDFQELEKLQQRYQEAAKNLSKRLADMLVLVSGKSLSPVKSREHGDEQRAGKQKVSRALFPESKERASEEDDDLFFTKLMRSSARKSLSRMLMASKHT
eukprot:768814-Hanusia_phi.AAC.1